MFITNNNIFQMEQMALTEGKYTIRIIRMPYSDIQGVPF